MEGLRRDLKGDLRREASQGRLEGGLQKGLEGGLEKRGTSEATSACLGKNRSTTFDLSSEACTDDLEQVKRFGGWKSDAVHAYLYADHAASKTRASDLLRSKPILSSAQCSDSQPARDRVRPQVRRPSF